MVRLTEKLRLLEVYLHILYNVNDNVVLQKSHVSLKRKVSEQALEIRFLKSSSAEMSSASEVQDSSPSFTSPQWRTPSLSKRNSEDIPVSYITGHIALTYVRTCIYRVL